MITRTKLKNLIYSKTQKLTAQKFHDDSWDGVTQIKNTIANVIEENGGGYYLIVSVPNGGYKTSKDGMSQWKEYWIDIYCKDDNLQNCHYSNDSDHPVIVGTLNCHAAGTIEDPFDSYDMSLVIWLNNSLS